MGNDLEYSTVLVNKREIRQHCMSEGLARRNGRPVPFFFATLSANRNYALD